MCYNEKKKPTSKIDSEYRIEARGVVTLSLLFYPVFGGFDYEGIRDYE